MRFHVLANPLVPLQQKNTFDAYTAKTFRFYEVFAPRHPVIIYGSEGSDEAFPLAQYVSVLPLTAYTYDIKDPHVMTIGLERDEAIQPLRHAWEAAIIPLLTQRYQPGDIILHICDDLSYDHFNVPMLHLSFSLGYYRASNPFVSCETNFVAAKVQHVLRNGKPLNPLMNRVIYPYFNPAEFTITTPREPRCALFLGRLITCKGYDFILKLAALRSDWTFLCAGGHPKNFTPPAAPNVIVLEPVGPDTRSLLLHRASVLLQPSQYEEPCGYNVIEAAIVGCPVIVPPCGGFRETVDHSVTGLQLPLDPLYWSQNLERASDLDSNVIKRHGARFTRADVWYQQYHDFFEECREVFDRWLAKTTTQ